MQTIEHPESQDTDSALNPYVDERKRSVLSVISESKRNSLSMLVKTAGGGAETKEESEA